MSKVSCKATIHLPADAIWQIISNFGTACQYLVGVIQCTVAGEGVGAQRTLTNVDGSVIVERLETLDKVNHRLSYTLLTETPFYDCLTTMQVHDLGLSQCEIEWSATFEADGLPADEARAMLEAALTANCLALKQFMESGRK